MGLSRSTKAIERVPSDAGVTFEGFEEVRIPSREVVRTKLEDFLRLGKSSQKPAVRILLGEWGEGKTDAFRRYLRPTLESQGDHALFVSASTLANVYTRPEVARLIQGTALSAVKFLVALFESVREESNDSGIPLADSFADPHNYLKDVLDKLVEGKRRAKIFVFIDEFEELLTNPARLNEVISGIKETVNGGYKEIDEGGRFPGALHLIIAATPDSYYQLQIKPDASLVFGGLGRRSAVIDLPQVSRSEGTDFLYSLIRYSYKNELPPILPVQSEGILLALYRIAEGNPGNMVSLFTRAVSSCLIDKKTMSILDSETLLGYLEKETIFVRGGSSPCLETDTLGRYINRLSEQRSQTTGQECVRLLRLLLGEPCPFTPEDIQNRLGVVDVSNLLNIINDTLRRKESVALSTLKVSTLKRGKNMEDVLQSFKEYVVAERDQKLIRIDNYVEKLENFRDRITYPRLVENKIEETIFLPTDAPSITSFFEGISQEKSIELSNMIRRHLCDDGQSYMASDQVLEQIYPASVPRELEFLENRELRMKLWRDTTKNLADYFDRGMPHDFIMLHEEAGVFSTEGIGQRIPKELAEIREVKFKDFDIATLFYAVNGDVDSSDIESLHRAIRSSSRHVHCIVLLFTGDKSSEAEEKIANKELGSEGDNLIVYVHIHPTLAKRLIAMSRAYSDYRDEINEETFILAARRTLEQDIDLPAKLDTWIINQITRGKAIGDLDLQEVSDPRRFADTLRFFINFMNDEDKLDSTFEKNKKLLELVRYNSRIRLVPDIEYPQFTGIADDLVRNGFLEQKGLKYRVKQHPVEKAVLKLLSKEARIDEEKLEDYFVCKSPRMLKDVLVPILEYKGQIAREKTFLMLPTKSEISANVTVLYSKLTEESDERRYQEYGYVFMTKERGYRFVSIGNFKQFVDQLYESTFGGAGLPEETMLQRLSLLQKLLEYFDSEYLPLFDLARKEGEGQLSQARSACTTFFSDLEGARAESYKWFKIQIKNFIEESETKSLLSELESLVAASAEAILAQVTDAVKAEPASKEAFSFGKDETEAPYWNPKLFLIARQAKRIIDFTSATTLILNQVTETFNSLNDAQQKIVRKLSSKLIPEQARVSTHYLALVRALAKDLFSNVQPMTREAAHVREVLEDVRRSKNPIDEELQRLGNCEQWLDELSGTEKGFLASIEEAQSIESAALERLDLPGYVESASEFSEKLRETRNGYDALLGQDSPSDSEEAVKKIRAARAQLDNLSRGIQGAGPDVNAAWTEYREEISGYLSSTRKILGLLTNRYALEIDDVTASISSLELLIAPEDLAGLTVKLSELEGMRQKIGSKIYSQLGSTIGEREFKVLELIISNTKSGDKPWLSLGELTDACVRVLGIDRSALNQALERLTKEELIRSGVSPSL